MAMAIISILPLLAALQQVGASVLSNAKERPVMKVIRMLQDMSVELQKELDDDKQVHEMLGCWCAANEKEKTQAIELGTAKISQLEASMDEYTAKLVELKEKRKATQDEINVNHAAVTKSSAVRMKEGQAFHGEEKDLIEVITACKRAIDVLSKHNPELAQLRTVARGLQDAHVAQLVAVSKSLRQDQLEMLKGFMQHVGSGGSFLAMPYQSYAPQSGQIFGILKTLLEDLESDLSEAQKEELKAKEAYETLKAAKQEEIAAARKAVIQMDGDIGDFSEKHAQAAQEHEDTKAQLEIDQTFLADLKSKCSESEEEYDTRVKARMDEISAVEDTIKILNDDDAFDVFDKAVNTALIQTSSSSPDERKRRFRAIQVLQHSKDPKLALLATSVRLDTFTKVKEEIDKLVAELGKQQQEEVVYRGQCIDNLGVNERESAAADDKKTSLEAKIADLENTVKALAADIASKKAAVTEMEKQMSRASEVREAENADYQQTVSDQRLTQTILAKALARMKETYSFLQQQPGAAHIATSGNHTNAGNGPARFTKYEQNAAGGRVVAALETIIADCKNMEDAAIAAEQDSQTAYENFMKDSNKSIAQYSLSITNLSEALAKSKASLSMSDSDLKQTMEELEGLSDTLGDLHKSCDFVLNNFEARQAARAAEMDALKEAKAILSGMA